MPPRYAEPGEEIVPPPPPSPPQRDPSSSQQARRDSPSEWQSDSPSRRARHEADDETQRLRAQNIEQVEAMFEDADPQIKTYMLTQALMPGGPSRVAQKLGLHSRNRVGADLAQVAAWIQKNGEEEFRQKVGLRDHPHAPVQKPVKKDIGDTPRVRAIDPQTPRPDDPQPDRKTPMVSRASRASVESPKEKTGTHKFKHAFEPKNLKGGPEAETPKAEEKEKRQQDKPERDSPSSFMFSPKKKSE